MSTMTAQRITRVAELQEEAIKLGLDADLTVMHIAAKMGIKAESVTRYLRSLNSTAAPAAPTQPEEPADPVEVRRHKDRAKEASALLRDLEKRLVRAEDIRGEILELGQPSFSRLSPGGPTAQGGRRSAILHISDIQYGEEICIQSMDGVNSYDLDIANRRIARYFQKAHRFLTELWQGQRVEEVVVLLNGDMISGALHHELDRTDGARPLEAAKLVAQQLIAGISLLSGEGFSIRIISTPGNHGRMTLKPESKGHVLQNYDTLVAWFIEAAFNGNPDITVTYSKSVDALFNIFAFPMLVTHGDRMGSRGGQGFLGATATILRGHHKLAADYAQRGVNLYKIFTGHFHTIAETPFGFANGTMAGWSEYARDGRMRCAPASQDYFVIHEEHGIIESRHITLGTPEEGTSHDAKRMHGLQ